MLLSITENIIMMLHLISVFIGGGIGAVLRFIATMFSNKFFTTPIYGTFCVNVIGCFLIGLFFGFILNKADTIPQITRLFIISGILGGLTTFSTLNFEVFELIKSGKVLIGLSYLFVSCLIGLICTYMGYLVFSKV